MTIKELIEKLKEFPEDLEIFCEHDYWVYPLEENEIHQGYTYLTESGTYMELDKYEKVPEDSIKALILH